MTPTENKHVVNVPLTVGMRVQTPLGLATILGFEKFWANGMGADIVDNDPNTGGRVVCKLDEPKNWMHTELTPDPFIFRSQLSGLG